VDQSRQQWSGDLVAVNRDARDSGIKLIRAARLARKRAESEQKYWRRVYFIEWSFRAARRIRDWI
jgi:hypothetical protein